MDNFEGSGGDIPTDKPSRVAGLQEKYLLSLFLVLRSEKLSVEESICCKFKGCFVCLISSLSLSLNQFELVIPK